MRNGVFFRALVGLAFGLLADAQFTFPKLGASSPRPRTLLMPDGDPFYKPPPGWETKVPGSILASRPVPNPLTLNNAKAIKPKGAWQLLYRTQNSVGEPEATVVTVLEPYNAKKHNLFVYHFFSVCHRP